MAAGERAWRHASLHNCGHGCSYRRSSSVGGGVVLHAGMRGNRMLHRCYNWRSTVQACTHADIHKGGCVCGLCANVPRNLRWPIQSVLLQSQTASGLLEIMYEYDSTDEADAQQSL